VLRLERNEGGAGGFHEGIKHAHAAGHDYLWLMDDDTIPQPEALAELLAGRREAPDAALIVSKVVWTDGRIHPMNQPFLRWGATHRMIAAAEAGGGLVPLRAATFVSMLLGRDVVDRHGLPDKRYFIWSDDIEYSARVLREHYGYYATRSVAVHKTATAHTAVTSGDRFYFHVRNSIYMFRGGAWTGRELISLVFSYLRSIQSFLRHEGYSRSALSVVGRGLLDAIRPPRDPAGPYLRRR
jgi:rhamnopyranosyl-N-acetylglucosaminyl-diphospho-decaprenol beta-1,3/1,4-galactofuranosyltransferase